MVKLTYSQLGDGHWYLVAGTGPNKEEKEYAIFSLLDAPRATPPSCKHMELHILENAAQEIMERGNVILLLDIYHFVFNAILGITHESRGVDLCKIYSDDAMTRMVYQKFSDKLSKDYEVKFYGHWIEILKKPPQKS